MITNFNLCRHLKTLKLIFKINFKIMKKIKKCTYEQKTKSHYKNLFLECWILMFEKLKKPKSNWSMLRSGQKREIQKRKCYNNI